MPASLVAVNFAKELEKKVNALSDEYADQRNSGYKPKYQFEVQPGRVFDKIVQVNDHGGASVHAFVVKASGDLVKPAGWNAPQKSKSHPSGLAVRYNLGSVEGFKEAVGAIDLFGGYLYAR